MPLLCKYQDYDISLACETQERITEKFGEPYHPYFLILCDDKRVGALRVVRIDEASCRIYPYLSLNNIKGRGRSRYLRCWNRHIRTLWFGSPTRSFRKKGIAICTKSSVIVKPEKSITRMMCWTSCIMKRRVKINF